MRPDRVVPAGRHKARNPQGTPVPLWIVSPRRVRRLRHHEHLTALRVLDHLGHLHSRNDQYTGMFRARVLNALSSTRPRGNDTASPVANSRFSSSVWSVGVASPPVV